MKYTDQQLEEFHTAYMEAAIWASNDTEPDTPEQYHLTDESELSEDTQADMVEECKDFLDHHAHLIDSEHSGNDSYQVIKDPINRYLMVHKPNGYTVGLSGLDGTQYEHMLNGTDSTILHPS